MKWNEFLNSLNTTGGKIFLLIAILVWLGTLAAVMHITGHDPRETGITLESNAFTSLFTAILMHLKSNGK